MRNCLFERNQMGLLTWNNEAGGIGGREFGVPRQQGGRGRIAGRPDRSSDLRRLDRPLHAARKLRAPRGVRAPGQVEGARESTSSTTGSPTRASGKASYELEFPNGGIAYVLGNIIQQSAQTENSQLDFVRRRGLPMAAERALPREQHAGRRPSARWRLAPGDARRGPCRADQQPDAGKRQAATRGRDWESGSNVVAQARRRRVCRNRRLSASRVVLARGKGHRAGHGPWQVAAAGTRICAPIAGSTAAGRAAEPRSAAKRVP